MKHPWNSQTFSAGARVAGRDETTIRAANITAARIKRAHPDLPVVLTLRHLAHLADVPYVMLRQIVDRKIDPYRIFRVKKRARPGGAAAPRSYRTICVPNPLLMRTQRWIAQNILNAATPHATSYAFTRGRGLVGAAERHAGCRWLVKLDVRNFFESIQEREAYRAFRNLGYGALVAFEMSRICTRLPQHVIANAGEPRDDGDPPYRRMPQGHLPQGAPTSPMLANLVAFNLDERLEAIGKARGWTYTRYADDLAFSTAGLSTRTRAMKLAALVANELLMYGLRAHRQKTTVISPGARKILLGVLVDRNEPKLTRAFRNNIETHLYALTHPKIGVAAHRLQRGFASTIGMKKHVAGLIAFAHQVNPAYARRLYADFNRVEWSS